MVSSALRTVVPPKPILVVSFRNVINKVRHKSPIWSHIGGIYKVVTEMILVKSKQDVSIPSLRNDYQYSQV